MAGKKLKVGIIGTGGIAHPHMKSYLMLEELDMVEVVAGADIVPGKAKAFMEEFERPDIRCYNSGIELLDNEELDAVSICTYNTEHESNVVYALKKGVNVLVEKPLCVTTEEAVNICRAEKESGKIVSVGFQPRFDTDSIMIKKIVQSGVLGDIYYIQTGGGRRRGIPGRTFIKRETGGVGALADIGCYALDLVLSAIGYPKPLTVTGYTSNFFGTNPKYYSNYENFTVDDDFAAAFIRLEGGIVVDFRISWAMHPDTPGDTVIFGKDGALRIPSTNCWNGPVGGPMTIYHDVAGVPTETKLPQFETKEWNFLMKVRSFVEAVRDGAPAPVPTSEILYNQAIIDGINKSAHLGREIEINIPEI